MAAVAAMATVAARAMTTMTAVVATVMATVTILGNRFGFQWLQFKFGNFAFTTAGPHARPLAISFLWRLLAALTTWVINTCSKGDWKRHGIAVTATATSSTAMMAAFWTSKATATITTSTT